jgi:hypothetical protein
MGTEPTWHQVIELPRVAAVLTEFQGHARTCPCCSHVTREAIPAEITADAFGPRLGATMNYLAGSQHVSQRGLEEIAEDLFGVPVSLGSVGTMQQDISGALEVPHQQIGEEVRQEPYKNVDGANWKHQSRLCWLWVATTNFASYFLVHSHRGQDELETLECVAILHMSVEVVTLPDPLPSAEPEHGPCHRTAPHRSHRIQKCARAEGLPSGGSHSRSGRA